MQFEHYLTALYTKAGERADVPGIAAERRDAGSWGLNYRSARREDGECIAGVGVLLLLRETVSCAAAFAIAALSTH